MAEEYNTRGAPWDWQPSLEAMAEEVGVNFDALIDSFRRNQSDEQMASQFGVPVKTITGLREHFEKFGIDSMMGQD